MSAPYLLSRTSIVECHHDSILLGESNAIERRIGTRTFDKTPPMNPDISVPQATRTITKT